MAIKNKKLKTEVKQLKTEMLLTKDIALPFSDSTSDNSTINIKYLTAGIAILTGIIGFSFGKK